MQNGSHVFLNGAFVLALALELDCLFTACLFGHLAGRVILAPIFLLFQQLHNSILYFDGFDKIVYSLLFVERGFIELVNVCGLDNYFEIIVLPG